MDYALCLSMEDMNEPNQNSQTSLPHVQTRPIPRIKVWPKPGIKRLKLPDLNPVAMPAPEGDSVDGE